MNTDFVLSQTDSRPMYQQIMGHIKERVSVGDWPEGMKIPSIRELAVALKVSVITVKRAYQELEFEGVITIQHGRGAFVASAASTSGELLEMELTDSIEKCAKLAVNLNLSIDELEERLKKAMDKIMETAE